MSSDANTPAASPAELHQPDRAYDWTHSRHDRPKITVHAQQRWDERTPWWSCSPEYAYNCAVPIVEIKPTVFASTDIVPDRVRVYGNETEHGRFGAIIYIVEKAEGPPVWTTVMRLEDVFLSAPTKAYLWTLLDQQGLLEIESDPDDGLTQEYLTV